MGPFTLLSHKAFIALRLVNRHRDIMISDIMISAGTVTSQQQVYLASVCLHSRKEVKITSHFIQSYNENPDIASQISCFHELYDALGFVSFQSSNMVRGMVITSEEHFVNCASMTIYI